MAAHEVDAGHYLREFLEVVVTALLKEWFVVHTLTGQEYKVKDSIEKRLALEEMTELIEQVLIPTEKVSEVKKGVRSTSTRKFLDL